MTERTFRLLELHQKLDAAIRSLRASRFSDPMEIMRLTKRKLKLRDRLARLIAPPSAIASL